MLDLIKATGILLIFMFFIGCMEYSHATEVKDLKAHDIEAEEVAVILEHATSEEVKQYKACVMEDEGNCMQDVFGDIHN